MVVEDSGDTSFHQQWDKVGTFGSSKNILIHQATQNRLLKSQKPSFDTNTRTSSWLNLSFRRKPLSLDCLIHPSGSMPAFFTWFPSAPWYPEGLRRQRNAAAAALFPGKRTGEWSPPHWAHGQVKKAMWSTCRRSSSELAYTIYVIIVLGVSSC